MARSSFRLPDIQELSTQQRDALDLPLEGRHLIVGGPGTGKSVVALLRARALARENKNYLFLVYNVLLDKNCYAFGGAALRAVTWKKWFKDTFVEWFGCPMPVDAAGNEDWQAIEALEPLPDVDTSLYLVIDEGQDMPKQFYSTLIAIKFKNFYVVADQNQRITEHNSSREDIEVVLVLNTSDTLELTSNYRNSLPIARLAQEFFTNDPASPRVELPEARPGDIVPLMLHYGGNTGLDFSRIAEQILKAYDRNIDRLLCVITPSDAVRERICNSLREASRRVKLDHEAPEIQTYSSTNRLANKNILGMIAQDKCGRCGADMIGRRNNADGSAFWGCTKYPSCRHTKGYVQIDFRNGGIAVINQQSIKGLEFELVFIADIDLFFGTKDELMKKFYVMVSRARDNVVLLRTGNVSRQVEDIMPKDETLLERR